MDIGGAGSAAFRFHQLFKENGHESKLVVLDKYLKDKDVIGFRNKSTLLNRIIYRLFSKKPRNQISLNTVSKYHFLNASETEMVVKTKKIIAKLPYKPDAIFVYWISNFINAQNIKEIHDITGAPIYWLLTDMGPLTGGCHYSWDCLGYEVDCKNCPAIINNTIENNNVAFKNINFKKENLLKLPLSFIVPTTILEQQFLRSSLKTFNYHKFILPIDTEVFQPIEKNKAKKYFSISENKKVIFAGCSDFKDERKGMNYLQKALNLLFEDKDIVNDEILILIAGKNIEGFIKELKYNYQYLSVLKNDFELANAYSASLLFACPSVEDSGPMMINESILCGTPVVAFDGVGIANDLVIKGQTGYLAINRDEKDFEKGLKEILNYNEIEIQNISKKCSEISTKLMSKKELYKNHLLNLLTLLNSIN